jgi:hypothetical protein
LTFRRRIKTRKNIRKGTMTISTRKNSRIEANGQNNITFELVNKSSNRRRRNSLELFCPLMNFIKDNTIFVNTGLFNQNQDCEEIEFDLVFKDSFKQLDDKVRVDFDFIGDFYLDIVESSGRSSTTQRRGSKDSVELGADLLEKFLNNK